MVPTNIQWVLKKPDKLVPMLWRTIKFYDAAGKQLKEAKCTSKARRVADMCKADEKQIKRMYRPGYATAKIGTLKFKYDENGKPRFIGLEKE